MPPDEKQEQKTQRRRLRKIDYQRRVCMSNVTEHSHQARQNPKSSRQNVSNSYVTHLIPIRLISTYAQTFGPEFETEEQYLIAAVCN